MKFFDKIPANRLNYFLFLMKGLKMRFMSKFIWKATEGNVTDGHVQNVKFRFSEGSRNSEFTQNLSIIEYHL